MKDEIKENCSNCEYNRQCFIKKQLGAVECQKDKDYITNLQEENERLAKLKERYQLEKEVYKSRCEKAIEYCNYNDESLYTFEPDYDYEENMVDNYEPSNFREDLLNILNGGENNVKDKR